MMKLKRRDNKCYKNSYKKIITKTSVKILDEYKNNYNDKKYELIKGKELINLIENIEEKIVTLNNTSFNILDLFEKYIYGLTPLYTACNKAFETFEMSKNNKNILILISDGLLTDYKNNDAAKKEIISKSNNCLIKSNIILILGKIFYLIFQPN